MDEYNGPKVIVLKYLERSFVRDDDEIRVGFNPRSQRVVEGIGRDDLVGRQVNALTLELMAEGYQLGFQSIEETV